MVQWEKFAHCCTCPGPGAGQPCGSCQPNRNCATGAGRSAERADPRGGSDFERWSPGCVPISKGAPTIIFCAPLQMPPDAMSTSILPTLADDPDSWLLVIGTPAGIGDALFELFQRGQDPAYERWASVLYPVTETGVFTDQQIGEFQRDATTPGAFEREFMCSFYSAQDEVLIPFDLVQAAMSRRGRPEMIAQVHEPKILSCDPARFGADSSVIFQRWGRVAYPPKVFNQIDNMALVGQLAQVANDWQPDAIMIDEGHGQGIIDRMRQLGYDVIAVNFASTAPDDSCGNLRSYMWLQVKKWLQDGAYLPNDQRLLSDLTSPQYFFNASNKLMLEPKEKVKARLGKSPDWGDALAISFAYPVAKKTVNETPQEYARRNMHERALAHRDYDPFAGVR
ncbi:hypothetical protein SuNHUV7_30940 (plasmid) [Pseudoseohaeicola sp. NH-UV-7]